MDWTSQEENGSVVTPGVAGDHSIVMLPFSAPLDPLVPAVVPLVAEVPDADVPDADVPDADVPDAEVPAADVPDADVPEAADVPDELPDDEPQAASEVATAIPSPTFTSECLVFHISGPPFSVVLTRYGYSALAAARLS
jgi:hypothetical protein